MEPFDAFGVDELTMVILRDPYIILLAVLLIGTLGAFVLGFLPYPIGTLLLLVLLMMRLRALRRPGNQPDSRD